MSTTLQTSPMLQWATLYARMGWSVVPLRARSKLPVKGHRWKDRIKTRATEEEIREMWERNPTFNIAVALGPVSDDLIVRDFDSAAAYRNWAERYPEEARRLPTVRSGRDGEGWHVYCRGDCHQIEQRFDGAFTHDFGDGELRSRGAYIVAPPSIHDITGRSYTWLMPDAERMLLLPEAFPRINDLDAIGFLSPWSTVTSIAPYPVLATAGTYDGARELTTTKDCLPLVCPRMFPEQEALTPPLLQKSETIRQSGAVCDAVNEAIEATVPNRPLQPGERGIRKKRIHAFGRRLKAIPELRDLPAVELKPYLQKWHSLAQPHVKDKDFLDSWQEFTNIWDRGKIRVPYSEKGAIMSAAMERVIENPGPLLNESTEYTLIVALCRELQREHGDKPFFLTCRVAAKNLGWGDEENSKHKRAWQLLKLAESEGYIQCLQIGKRQHASQYRYLKEL